MTDLLGPAEVLALLADPEAPERCSPLTGSPLLAIDLRGRRSEAPADAAAGPPTEAEIVWRVDTGG